jgi:hypothetical protein
MSRLNVAITAALVFFASPVAAKTHRVAEAAPACAPGLHKAYTAELFFGRNIGQTVGVDDQAWQAFLDREVTPRFPDGLSVYDVYGQYRGQGGAFIREPTKALLVVMSDAPHDRVMLHEIRDAYRDQFRQESVMLIERGACISF